MIRYHVKRKKGVERKMVLLTTYQEAVTLELEKQKSKVEDPR